MRLYALISCFFACFFAYTYSFYVAKGYRKALKRPRCIDTAIHDATVEEIASMAIYSLPVTDIFSKSLSKATSGGLAGASAAAVQVLSLMWLR